MVESRSMGEGDRAATVIFVGNQAGAAESLELSIGERLAFPELSPQNEEK